MKKAPLTSILINNYNYGHFLKDAINSAIAQTYPNTEIIVVDDGSTDNSREIIADYGDRIIPILKENGGQSSTFNAGFTASQGDIIFLLDADDLFLPSKVEETIKALEKHPESGWCFHPQTLVNGEKKPIPSLTNELGKSKQYDLRETIRKGKINPFLPPSGLPATSAFSFRRSLLKKILPMPEANKITISDDYLKFAALGLSPCYVIEKELSQQRIHGNNAFTLAKEKTKVKAKIDIFTAYWLKKNFLNLSKLANNIFANGIYYYQTVAARSEDVDRTIDRYMSSLTLLEKLNINLRTLFYRLKK